MSEPIPRAPIAAAPISVILTARALATQTADALSAWREQLAALNRPGEILLIQETRPETTLEPIDAAVRVFPYERTTGCRDALAAAIAAAQYPLVAFCPCDFGYRPGDLDGMLKLIDEVDLVIGYRSRGQAPPWRVLLDTAFGLFSRVVLGVPIEPRVCWLGWPGWGRRLAARWLFAIRVADPECPYRLARRAIFERMPLQSGGPFVAVEMIAKANFLGCYLAQAPVQWTPPPEPQTDAIGFWHEAWHVFHRPLFGAVPPPVHPIPDTMPPG